MDAQVCIEPGNAGPIHVVLGGPGAPYLDFEMWAHRIMVNLLRPLLCSSRTAKPQWDPPS